MGEDSEILNEGIGKGTNVHLYWGVRGGPILLSGRIGQK